MVGRRSDVDVRMLEALCVRELGWVPRWLGRRTPADGILGLLDAVDVGVVALSASAVSTDGTRESAGERGRLWEQVLAWAGLPWPD